MDTEPPGLYFLAAFDSGVLISIIILIVLLICSALISGAEVAFFSLNSVDFETNENKSNQKKLSVVKKLVDDPEKLLATILVSNNFINIAIVLIFGSISDVFFKNFNAFILGVSVRFILEVGLATFLILLFGEILPKVYASRKKIDFALFMAYPINVLDYLLSPVSVPMKNASGFLQKKFGKKKNNFNVEQLSQALELSQEDTTQEEQKILKGIVTFGNTQVRQVMKNRMDIFALSEDLSFSEVLDQILIHGFSRIPIYKENIDHINGILYVKDLIAHVDKVEFEWNKLIRDVYFVPENKKLDDLLSDFKEMKMHLAIVVDEYGGTSGLISLEDIIEEIVGEISDEFDDEGLIFSKLDDRNYIFEGKTSLKDFYKVIGLEDPHLFEDKKGEAESLAGFLLEISKGFPKKNEIIYFEHYAFIVEGFEGKRIKQIKLTIEDQ